MADWKLHLYKQMPASFRSVAASMRGLELRHWRYGADTPRYVEEAKERETWSKVQWKAFIEEELEAVLHIAATEVPFYRDQWATRRQNGDKASWQYLENWPILEKATVRQHNAEFVPDTLSRKKLLKLSTSGTSGTPLSLWWTKESYQNWYAIHGARTRHYFGLSWKDNWAILGGQLVVPLEISSPPFWIWNAPLNQLYLSTHHITRKNAPYYARAICQHKITHMFVYTSSATVLAQHFIDLGIILESQLKVIFTNAEPLFDWQREILEKGFGCQVRETYGMGEIVAAGSEDNQHRLRQWPEIGHIEVAETGTDRFISTYESGDFICTSLMRKDMPLIRYRVGDRGALGADWVDGELPTFAHIEGRSNDLILTEDGRQIFWLNPVFYGLPVQEAQIIQQTITDLDVLYVPSMEFDGASLKELQARLVERVGNMNIMFHKLDEIPREKNGKFRPVINNIPEEIRLRFLRNEE